MKQTRLKRAARILSVYRYNFGVTPPYQVVMDGTYAQAALTEKLNLSEQLPKYLGAPVELYTTKCCLDELTKLGKPLYGALCIAKLQQIAECPHNPPRGAGDCLAHLARRSKKDSKKRKFIFATQDHALQEKLRAVGGIPILYIAYKTVLLDPVSEATTALLETPTDELETIKELKKEILGEEEKKKKRKKRGVNPLSCKKKALKAVVRAEEGTKTANGKRRRRKKGGESGGGRGGEKMVE